MDDDMDLRVDTKAMDPPIGLDADSFSPSGSPTDGFDRDNMFSKEVEFPGFDKQMSADSDDGASSTIVTDDGGSRWGNTYDNESRSGFESVSSARSRRSIERDALRKYVRQRYMSKREKA